ncbi:phosphate signaling complex protein PhoU [Streptococcus sp. 20-1249]|uniref:phosphate signaling complex protein PhoU n=1 Tax=Streptococcus hepaticus TaxID=3349163 RepID=UPI00374A3169
MIRSKFTNQLNDLNKEIIFMGALCEDIIGESLAPLTDGQELSLEGISETYHKIEEMERDIEEKCLKLLLRQQPVAKDLRRISSALKMVYDMKRIGARSYEIAEIISLVHIVQGTGPERQQLDHMSKNVIEMLTKSIDAFIYETEEQAHQVIQQDKTVNQEFDTIKKQLVLSFSVPDVEGEYPIDVLMVAKYLERIGDHAVNIAKWVLFSITGHLDGDV